MLSEIPLRRRLLEVLSRRPLTVSEMAVPLGCAIEVVDDLATRLSDEGLVLSLDDPGRGECLFVLSLQGAQWIDRHGADGESMCAVGVDQDLPIAGQPLALVAKAGRWSVVPSYFAAASARLPPDTAESRAAMAFAAGGWCNRRGFHNRTFCRRSLAEVALADALREDPPPWALAANRSVAEDRWPPAGEPA